MPTAFENPEAILNTALSIVQQGDRNLLSALDNLPAPIYVTDAEGMVTYFNRSCVGFSGRMPAIGKDRWCVTWKLYTDAGVLLPHDQCPMAQTIKTQRAIRGVTAVAERPDGTRVNFVPHPTPLWDESGVLTGAVNMLIDVTDERQIADLRAQAHRCRRLASSGNDQQTIALLMQMAEEYDAKAVELERLRSRKR
jgi:PAS domain-containing protein